ncbi:MAG TPA: RidA family protein [Chitinophagaceae bacterium]|nr:RidA family protein [Chitinophagaceae bacterium]
MQTQGRRSAFRKLFGTLIGLTGISALAKAGTTDLSTEEKTSGSIVYDQEIPLFSGHTLFGGLVFVAGKGAHFEGDIKSHTDHVLKELETELKKAGSSMDRVLKVNVYLADLNDYKGMNEVFRGRFGENPPVRTTVATYGGVPGASLVEMDCIAYTKKP